jgi:hypothetical protein
MSALLGPRRRFHADHVLLAELSDDLTQSFCSPLGAEILQHLAAHGLEGRQLRWLSGLNPHEMQSIGRSNWPGPDSEREVHDLGGKRRTEDLGQLGC